MMAQHFQRLLVSQSWACRICSTRPKLISFNCLGVWHYKMLPQCNSFAKNNCFQMIHVSSVMNYMGTKHIPLPENIEDINAAEKSQFSPHRSRDISGPVILSKTMGTFINNQFATSFNSRTQPTDPRLHIYDCRGPVSLHSSMQTNVPDPFSPKGRAMHLNMPGGQWGQGHKYISDDMQNFHYWNTAHQYTTGGCYLVVASGVELESLESLLKTFGLGSTIQKGGTLVVAYAIHKLFAPVRLGITAVSVPFIVRYLRGVGILKPP